MTLICPDCGSRYDSDHACHCGHRPRYFELPSDEYQAIDRSKRGQVYEVDCMGPLHSFKEPIITQCDAQETVKKYNDAYPSLTRHD